MLKRYLPDNLWVIDGEWIPDAVTGRRLLGLGEDVPEEKVWEAMWAYGGGTTEKPKPYLKVILCRVVALTVISRRKINGTVKLKLTSLPAADQDGPGTEEAILSAFWGSVINANNRADYIPPVIAGFNVGSADLGILSQRAVSKGIHIPHRPNKAWETTPDGYGDYFDDRNSTCVIDLKGALAPYDRRDTPRLHEICSASGIPGKLGVGGDDVAGMWQAGAWRRITRYNQCDVASTYLLWLRVAFCCGILNQEEVESERAQVIELMRLESHKPEGDLPAAWVAEAERLAA